MDIERCVKWEPASGVDRPCADLSMVYDAPHSIVVRMQYSRAIGNPELDLEIQFKGAIALRWEEEAIGLNPLPEPLPTISSGKWVFPLLRIEGSRWLQQHHDRNPILSGPRIHFALVTMNDLIQLLALPDPEVSWVHAEHAV